MNWGGGWKMKEGAVVVFYELISERKLQGT
jgi:hypothetical protein